MVSCQLQPLTTFKHSRCQDTGRFKDGRRHRKSTRAPLALGKAERRTERRRTITEYQRSSKVHAPLALGESSWRQSGWADGLEVASCVHFENILYFETSNSWHFSRLEFFRLSWETSTFKNYYSEDSGDSGKVLKPS